MQKVSSKFWGIVVVVGIVFGIFQSTNQSYAVVQGAPELTPESVTDIPTMSTDVVPGDETPTVSPITQSFATIENTETSTPTDVINNDSVESSTRDPWTWGPRVGGGSGIGIRDVSGYVYISVASTSTSKGWRCNGALIDPSWVVTNAGCMVEPTGARPKIATTRVKVVPGCYSGVDCVNTRNSLWYGTRSDVYTVQQIEFAPGPVVIDQDLTVALIKLSRPVTTGNGVSILPIGTSSDVVVGQNGLTVMSYGDIASNKGPTALQRAAYRIANDSSCSTLNGYQSDIHYCGEPTPQVCKSDFGAPVTRVVNGQSVLYGILASQFSVHGSSCPTNARSVAIDVTNTEIRTWIATLVNSGRSGIVSNQNESGGLGTALARGNNRQHVIDISGVFPLGIKIGSTSSTKLSINDNGVIALGGMTSGIPEYINLATWSGGKAPIIVAFGADGDTTGAAQRSTIGSTSNGSNQVWVAQDPDRRVVVITWDDIRPFSTSVTGVRYIGNTYQAELRAQENGDVKVTLRYGVIGWTAGAKQCGTNCNGKYAQIGIADGRGKFQLGVPVVATSDAGLRQLSGKQLTFYLRDGVINKVNQVPPVRPTWTASPTRTPTSSPTATPISQGLTNGLLAWYPLNGIRSTGSTLPVQASTIMGAAQSFDGVNDYHQTNIDLANTSFTVAFWGAFNTKSGNHMVVSAGSSAANYQALQIYINNTGVVCDFYANGVVYLFGTTGFDITKWHHYACTYDRNTGLRQLIIDGVVVESNIVPQSLNTTGVFQIGRSPWNNDYVQGSLRDVMVYNRALSTSEINRIKDLTPNSVMISEPHPASDCRWVDKGGMVHEYEINHDLLTWDQAKAAAEARTRGGQQGYLATITNQAENDCLTRLITVQNGWLPSTDGPFIGGNRIGTDGVFGWEVGPEQGMMFNKYLGYVNWYGSAHNVFDLNPDPRLTSNVMFILRSDAPQWNNTPSTWNSKSIIEYTYPETHAIRGVAYTDVNNNNRFDSRDTRMANQVITLTADIAKPIDIVGGGNQVCARLDDGQVVCWGRRGDTWRWDQQSAVPIEIDAWRNARAISNGFYTSCALLANGTVSCLGKNSFGAVGDGSTADRWQPVTISGLSGVVALNSGGGYHHCAVLANGTVKCWGGNTYGQLGDGSYTTRSIPVTVTGLSGVRQISVGERYTCARKSDGTIWCWGSNEYGQLATTGIVESRTPRQVSGITSAKQLVVGWQHACVIRSDNQVACWGHPGGINGNRSGSYVTTPTVIANTTNSVSLGVGFEQSCVAKTDGTVWCWGHAFHGEAGWIAIEPGNVTTVRRNSAVQMPSLTDITQVTLTTNSGCGRRSNGDVLCWGEANMGQLGDGTYQARGIAREIRVTWQTNPYAARVAVLDGGYLYHCGILTDRRVACWGVEGFYRPNNTYIKPEPEIVAGLSDIVDINVGTDYTCALQRTGTIWCWGYSLPTAIMESGTLSGYAVERVAPRRITSVTNAIALATSGGNCLAVTADTAVYCIADWWTNMYKLVPNTAMTSIGSIGPSYIHNCALKQDGTVWCWGDNSYFAQYGNGVANTTNDTPVKVNGLETIQQLAVANYHNCVLLSTGQVQCWGIAGGIGTDGTGQQTASRGQTYSTPKLIDGLSNIKKIATNYAKNCAVHQDGTVWCWGGILYTGERSESIVPYQISGITDAIDVSIIGTAQSGNVCVLRRGGEVQCWGIGESGGLGNGQTTNRTIPRPINEPWQANVHRGCEWVDWQGQRHWYESLDGSWTWTQARDMAAARTSRGVNGYLATITSPEENRCVHQLYMKSTTTEHWPGVTAGSWPRRWLGGSDADSEGTWKWVTGPEAGTTFRIPTGLNPGYNAFQTISAACKPNCADPTWDYVALLYLHGTHVQHNQWDDEVQSDTLGALVEYTSAGGDSGRTYTTTTDGQGQYDFVGLAPGVYILERTVNGNIQRDRVVVVNDQLDADLNLRNVVATPTRTVTRTSTRTATRALKIASNQQYMQVTMTPTFTPTR